MATKGRKDEMGHLISFLKCFELRNAVINPVHRSGWQSLSNPRDLEDTKIGNLQIIGQTTAKISDRDGKYSFCSSEIPSVQEDIGVVLLDNVN